MTPLLDTHTFLCFCQGGLALSATAKRFLKDQADRKRVSLPPCWESVSMAALGKLTLGEPASTCLPNASPRPGSNCSPSPWVAPSRWNRSRTTTATRSTGCSSPELK